MLGVTWQHRKIEVSALSVCASLVRVARSEQSSFEVAFVCARSVRSLGETLWVCIAVGTDVVIVRRVGIEGVLVMDVNLFVSKLVTRHWGSPRQTGGAPSGRRHGYSEGVNSLKPT